MSIDVTVSIEIDRPREDVAAYACDPDNDTTWYVAIKEVKWLTDKPAGVGTRVARVAHFLGKKLKYTYVVDELVPGERLVMRAEAGPFPMVTTYTWEDAGDGRTRMHLNNSGGPAGFFAIASPLLARQVRSATEKDVRELKRILEAAD